MSEEKKDITKTKSPETFSPKSERNAQAKEKKNVQRAISTRKQEQPTPKIDSTRQKSTKKTTTRKKKVPKVVFKKTHVAILAFSIIVVCSLILTVAIFRYSDPRGAVQKEVTATQKTELTLQGDSSAPADSSGRQGSDEMVSVQINLVPVLQRQIFPLPVLQSLPVPALQLQTIPLLFSAIIQEAVNRQVPKIRM